jgi:two-component system OmpR family sensor kinase
MSALRPLTFRARLTLRWTCAIAVLLGAANVSIYAVAGVYLHRWLDGNVRTLAATEAASSTDGLDDVHLHDAPFSQLQADAYAEKVVQIFDARGTVVLQSASLDGTLPLITGETVAAAIAQQAPLVSVTVRGRPVRMAVLRADRDGRPFAVAVGLFADDVEAGLSSLAVVLATVWTVCVVFTALIGYRLAARALAPIAGITERAASIARGNFDARLEPPPVNDEVGRMSELLNSMLDRLQAAVDANRRFASDASHELRTPLTAMMGEIDVTLRHPRTSDEYLEALRSVQQRLGGMARLAEDLILLARTQEGTRDLVRREVSLAGLVQAAFERVRHAAVARGIELRDETAAGLVVYGDPSLLERVFDNVVANAVHYNRDGGEVVVRAAMPPRSGDAWATSDVCVEITDTGMGIPAEERERIFDRFYRVDRSRARRTGGNGLGLAIAREVVALHGGTLRVGSSSEAGTTIRVDLPGGPTVVGGDHDMDS